MTNRLTTKIIAGAATIIIGLGSLGCRKDLTPQDFTSANWIEYTNPDNSFYGAYLAEDITHNQDNLQLYGREVKEYNQKNIEQ